MDATKAPMQPVDLHIYPLLCRTLPPVLSPVPCPPTNVRRSWTFCTLPSFQVHASWPPTHDRRRSPAPLPTSAARDLLFPRARVVYPHPGLTMTTRRADLNTSPTGITASQSPPCDEIRLWVRQMMQMIWIKVGHLGGDVLGPESPMSPETRLATSNCIGKDRSPSRRIRRAACCKICTMYVRLQWSWNNEVAGVDATRAQLACGRQASTVLGRWLVTGHG